MKYHRIASLGIVIVSIFTLRTSAQWVQTNGPAGGQVTSFAVTDHYIYAGVWGGGVYRSADRGATWSIAGLKNLDVTALAVAGKGLFAGTASTGIYRSADEGMTWSAVSDGSVNSNIRTLAVSGRAIYAGTLGSGVYLSIDDGAHWKSLVDGTPAAGAWVEAFLVQGKNLFALGEMGGYRSTDAGARWMPLSNGLPFGARFTSIAAVGQDLFIGTRRYGIYRSSDNGTTWASVNRGLTEQSLDVNALLNVGGTLFAGTNEGIYRSDNHGDTWQSDLSSTRGMPVLSFASSPTQLYAGSRWYGPMVADLNGLSWKLSNSGMIATTVNALTSSGPTLIAGTPTGTCLSTDNGISWSQCGNDSNAIEVHRLISGGTCIFAGTPEGIFWSSDNGGSWCPSIMMAPIFFACTDFASMGSTLFAAVYGSGVLRSKDAGVTWTMPSTALMNSYIDAVAVSGGDVFAAGNNSVYRSVDEGAHWQALTPVPLQLEDAIAAMAVVDSALFLGMLRSGIYRSMNQGTTWTGSGDTVFFPPVRQFAVFARKLFVATTDQVYLSEDLGATWKSVSEGLENFTINSVGIIWPNLYIGTELHGVWRRPLAEMVSSQAPVRAYLQQNYPNPFNNSTNISFTTTTPEFVTLKIYDVLGREAATIVSEELPAGNYSHRWNAAGYASGVYFYRLQAGSSMAARRLILLK